MAEANIVIPGKGIEIASGTEIITDEGTQDEKELNVPYVVVLNENGNSVFVNLYPLKADETAATSNTDVVTVAQAGIKYADLANPHKTITMYVWFGADPAAGSQIPLVPGASWSGPVDNQADMRYKSSAAGGVLDYVLRG